MRPAKGSHRSHSDTTALVGRIGLFVCVLAWLPILWIAEAGFEILFYMLAAIGVVAGFTLSGDLAKPLPMWRLACAAVVLALLGSILIFASLRPNLSEWYFAPPATLLSGGLMFLVLTGWRRQAWRSHMLMHGVLLIKSVTVGIVMVAFGVKGEHLAPPGIFSAFAAHSMLLAMALPPSVHVRAHDLVCRKCDYDLRGSGGDICPECGEPIDPLMRHVIQKRLARQEAENPDD